MKRRTKLLVSILCLCTIIGTAVSTETAQAFSFNVSNRTIYVGDEKDIDLYEAKGKTPKWSLSNKNATIIYRGNTFCRIKAKKKGSVYVKCKIGKKTKKVKITIKAKSKVTYDNFNKIENGMTYKEVENLIGKYTEVYKHYTHTDEEYAEYEEMQEKYGGYEDELYHDQIEYKWKNPSDSHTCYVTFNDDSVITKDWH